MREVANLASFDLDQMVDIKTLSTTQEDNYTHTGILEITTPEFCFVVFFQVRGGFSMRAVLVLVLCVDLSAFAFRVSLEYPVRPRFLLFLC